MQVKVPPLDLQAQFRPLRGEILAAIARVYDAQPFILGRDVSALEEELSAAERAAEESKATV